MPEVREVINSCLPDSAVLCPRALQYTAFNRCKTCRKICEVILMLARKGLESQVRKKHSYMLESNF